MVELDAPEAYEAVTLKAIFNRKCIDSIRVHVEICRYSSLPECIWS